MLFNRFTQALIGLVFFSTTLSVAYPTALPVKGTTSHRIALSGRDLVSEFAKAIADSIALTLSKYNLVVVGEAKNLSNVVAGHFR